MAPIELQSGQISNIVDQSRIIDMPLITRDPYSLVLLSPGVMPSNATRRVLRQWRAGEEQ